jgi:hypothetical protein
MGVGKLTLIKEKTMKKSLKVATAMAVLASPAMAATTNLENPLYLPTTGEVYSRTGVGVMYKKTDANAAQVAKGHGYAEEFPIYRAQQDLGIGITDRIALGGQVGWTQDDDIGRKGMHLGRLGLTFRAMTENDPVILDLYADAHLGGISKMTGSITNTGFVYDNYTTGQYGVYGGFRMGKMWDKLTGMMFAEVGHFFAGDNTEINIAPLTPASTMIAAGLNPNVVAKIGTFTDWNIGTRWAYDFQPTWTSVFSFTYKHHAAHAIEGITADFSGVSGGALPTVTAGFNTLSQNFMGSLRDNFDEYILGVTLAKQLTDNVQVSVYGEYTFDDGGSGSQNTTDVKAELGVRANVRF